MKLQVIGASNEQAGGGYAGGPTLIWPYRLREQLAAAHPNITYTLVNSSVSGKDSKYFADNIAAQLAEAPDVLLIGGLLTNDASWWGQNNPLWVNSPAESEANLRAIVGASRAANNEVRVMFKQAPIAVQGDPGTGTANPAGFYPYGRDRARLIQANTILVALGAELGIPVVTSFDTAVASGHTALSNVSDTYLVDGVHQTAVYQQVDADLAYEAVSTFLDATGAIRSARPVRARAWNGTTWVDVVTRVWNGSTWIPVPEIGVF